MEKNLDHTKALEKFKKLTEEIGVCMFITSDRGNDHTRPMVTIETEDDGTLWFFSNFKTGKVAEIKEDDTVHLVYAHPGKESYLDVWGTASVVKDKETMEDKWTAIVKAWFPDGVDDPDLCLLKIKPEEAYYWDSETGKMIAMLKISAAAITGAGMSGSSEGSLNI